MSAEEVEGDQAREQALKRHMAELDDLIDHSKELLSYINFKFNKSFKSSRAESCFLTQQPASLKGGVLLEHQMSGVNWLICLYERKKNGILADDMGLGKTIQAIAFIAYLAEVRNDRGPHLVIVPKSVLSNFQEECLRWLPSHRSIILPGDYEARNFALQNYVSKRKFDILLATY
jgi:SNF2 family DNA or RNA helicase